MKHLAPLALSLALAAPLAAHAAASQETLSIPVGHADLDLSQPAGASIMLDRLDRAALTACGASTFSFRQVQDAVRASTCYRQGMERAVASLAEPNVTAVYHAHIQRLATD